MSIPRGYRRIEYLESTGTQWVDTGVLPVASAQRVVLAGEFVTVGSNNRFLGSYNGSTRSFTGQSGGSAKTCGIGQGSADIFPSGFPSITAGMAFAMDLTAGDGAYSYAVNGVTASGAYSGSRANGVTMGLFAMKYSSGTTSPEWVYDGTMRVRSCQIYTGDTLVRSFIPCKNASGEAGLWDNVEGVFYANAGTGSFVAGPELATPNDYAGIDSLITDRTEVDAERVKTLAAKGWRKMTEAERTEYLAPMKGAYNASDMNRVGSAVEYLAGRFEGQGYAVSVEPRTNRTTLDAPTEADCADYLGDVAALRRKIGVKPTTPALPTTMRGLTTDGANAIEQVLVDLDELLTNAEKAWFYSDEIYSGEV